jgi:hypothetical protein
VEYAYNTTPWGDSSDGNPANTGYGPQGAAFAAIDLTSYRSRRVKFLTPIQPTDDIDVQVSRDGGRSFMSVGKGMILSVNNYVFEKWAYVDGGQPFNTHGIGVNIVNANTGEVDVQFGQYFFIATDTTPTRPWSLEVNSNYRWRVVKSRNPLTIGGLTGSLWQQKTLPSSVSGTNVELTALRFNNLEIGKSYRLTYTPFLIQSPGASSRLDTTVSGSPTATTNIYANYALRRNLTSGAYDSSPSDLQACYSLIFIAETTTLYFHVTTAGCAAYGETFAPNKRATNAILEELPLHQQTSKWT